MATGTDVAMASAGITPMTGDLNGIVQARRLSAAKMSDSRQNLFWRACSDRVPCRFRIPPPIIMAAGNGALLDERHRSPGHERSNAILVTELSVSAQGAFNELG
jgi:hypothetical protein